MSSIADHIEAKSDQLNADDLMAGPRVITITRVTVKGKGQEQPVSIFYEGDNGKPYKPNKGMMRVLVAIWGDGEGGSYVGRSLRLYRDPTVKWGGEPIGGIKIGAASHIDKPTELYLQVKKGQKAKHVVEVLRAEQQQRAEPTINAARAALVNAPTIDRLERAWGSANMQPFREQLQSDYDARRAELAPEQMADGDGGGFDQP